MTLIRLEAKRHDIEDENGITYFEYGEGEVDVPFEAPTYLSTKENLEKLQDYYAGWCSINKPYVQYTEVLLHESDNRSTDDNQ